MKCFFAGSTMLRKVSGEDFVDYMALIKHDGDEVLLVSNLYNVETILRLVVIYFMHFGLKDSEVLRSIDEEYVGIAKKRIPASKKKERMDDLHKQIKRILKRESITVVKMWQHGFGAADSLKGFPEGDIRHLLPN